MYIISAIRNKKYNFIDDACKEVYLCWCAGYPDWSEHLEEAETYETIEEAEADVKVAIEDSRNNSINTDISGPFEIQELIISAEKVKKIEV